ncbi:MAG: biopolymer transporter ExbD [Bacteroidetes bacterium]|jgi:biopolymer transport protein ExbD|nr:biopolymer transporter ExbD [Bacteroidota bacterium]
MAEVNTDGGGGGKHEKKRAKKSSTKIDMTPMVDLAFLLLTFFVLTSTFSKPKTMEINFPAPIDDKTKQMKVNNALTFIMTKDDGIFYYAGEFYADGNDKGMPPTQLTKTDFSSEGLHKLLLEKNKPTVDAIKKLEEQLVKKEIADTTYKRLAVGEKGKKEALTVLIKADDKAVYKNIIDVIDELNVCNIGKYAVVDMMPKELELINAATK